MLKASKAGKPIFFCASTNIYLTEPVYKLLYSRTAKEKEEEKEVWLSRAIEVRQSRFLEKQNQSR